MAVAWCWFVACLFGHLVLWVGIFNRLHSVPLPWRAIKKLEKATLLLASVPWFAAIASWLTSLPHVPSWCDWLVVRAYAALCLVLAAVFLPRWLLWRLSHRTPSLLVSNDTRVVDVERTLGLELAGTRNTRWLATWPGNEIFRLSIHEKTLVPPRWSASLDGLSIAHLSDLHFTGQIRREFFEYIADQANAFDADLLVVTGDIIDRADCLPWIAGVLGRLRARHGCYFVLGNHDKRLPDIPALRREIVRAGLVDLGGGWQWLTIGATKLLLVGTERPWFGPAPNLDDASLADSQHADSAFRILLSHSPDQLPWARRQRFDLMLAGHTHGGQIRFPWIGPVVSASRFGVRYASGVFFETPTLMHVSRGLSGVQPVRFRCPPELTKLVLKSKLL